MSSKSLENARHCTEIKKMFNEHTRESVYMFCIWPKKAYNSIHCQNRTAIYSTSVCCNVRGQVSLKGNISSRNKDDGVREVLEY